LPTGTHAAGKQKTFAIIPKSISISFYNDVEKELARDKEFGDVPDIGAKIPENAARIAANFHVFEHGPSGEISEREIDAAIRVASWHLSEARRIVRATPNAERIADAELLFDWLVKNAGKSIDPRTIQRFGPVPLRNKKRRDAAIQVLVEKRLIFLVGSNPTRIVVSPRGHAT